MGADLSTTYLGLGLRTPLVASASPLSQTADGVVELVEAGVGAVVLNSLFEEQISGDAGDHPHWFANPAGPGAPERYLRLVEESVRSVDVPVVASLNGTRDGEWVEFARELERAGAAAVELNYALVPDHLQAPGRDVERACLELAQHLRATVTIPVSVKLPPYFSSFGELALRLVESGADGLVLFNRFVQARIDEETMSVRPVLDLSSPSDARLPQTWIAILRERLDTSLAGTGGVHSGRDVAGYVLAGADVVMVASVLLRHGRGHASVLLRELEEWAREHDVTALSEVRGRLAVPWQVDPHEYQRDGYVATLQTARRSYVPHRGRSGVPAQGGPPDAGADLTPDPAGPLSGRRGSR